MKKYEFVFIVKPDLTSVKVKKSLGSLRKEIEGAGGKIEKDNDWGEKPLAYPINNYERGRYYMWELSFPKGPQLKNFDTFLSRQQEVIRHLMIKVKS